MSELARAGDWLSAWAGARDLPADVIFAIRLCLEEVLANILTHAFAGGDHAILVDIRRDDGEVVLSVHDDGKPFDPLAATAAIPDTSLAEAEIGGHGLILLKGYASRLAYERKGGRNRLVMGFCTPADETPGPGR